MDDTSTLSVRSSTKFAMTPRWVARAGKALSPTAKALYTVIMTYASNGDRSAFPGQALLASDLGVSTSTVHRAMKELETFGALEVERRRNKRTGNFFANRYVLVFDEPPTSDDEHNPRSEPSVTSGNGHLSLVTAELDPPLTTPTPVDTAHSVIPESGTGNPDGLTLSTFGGTGKDAMSPRHRTMALAKLRLVGGLLNQGHHYYSEPVQEAWDDFAYSMDEYTADWPDNDVLVDLLVNGKWTVTKNVQGAYEAGIELNKMLNTARVTL